MNFLESIILVAVFLLALYAIPSYFLIKSANKKDKEWKNINGDTSKHNLKSTVMVILVSYTFFFLFFSISTYDNIKRDQYYENVKDAIRASDCFSSVDYDPEEDTLLIVFKDSGSCYKYYNFSQEEFDKFIFSESMGRYYNSNIKGKYPVLRLY